MAGGPTGNFIRLASTPARKENSIAFDLTDPASHQVTVDFDMSMIPAAVSGSAPAPAASPPATTLINVSAIYSGSVLPPDAPFVQYLASPPRV